MPGPLIAVVDDDAVLRDLLHELLTDEGYATLLLAETAGLVEAFRQTPPALVILDIRLEDRSAGWRVLEALRQDAVTGQVPIIVCSADRRCLEDRAAYLTALGCVVLAKPFDLDDLLHQVRACLEHPPRPAVTP